MLLDWIAKDTADAIEQLDLNISTHISEGAVPEIHALLKKTVLFRGKKLRPTLCFLMGQLFGMPLEKMHPYARAAEFVHAATLAHDDVIDDNLMRRNQPTLNAQTSNSKAVLAGDFLLARVMTELASLGEIHVIQDLAMTVEELVYGEWLQLDARHVIPIQRSQLETIAKKKTASLISWCCRTPGRLLSFEKDLLIAATQFGEHLGLAFQMVDDVLDYHSSGDKPFAQDLQEGLINFVTLEMIENNTRLIPEIQKLFGTPFNQTQLPWTPQELNTACNRIRARSQFQLNAADQILTQMQSSITQKDTCSQNDALCALRAILMYLQTRSQ